MKDYIPPEEKLLKLIKNSKKQGNDDKPVPLSSLNAQETNPAYKTSAGFSFILKYFSFPNIRNLIYFIFAFSLAYLIISFAYPWFGFKNIASLPVKQEIIPDLKLKTNLQTKPFESYLSSIRARRIFGNTTGTETSAPTALSTDTKAALIEQMTVIGIISGENYQAVIEDKKLQKTFSVVKGQSIGEFQVVDIQNNKVVLDYAGRKYELYF